jgi:hypothetical protein
MKTAISPRVIGRSGQNIRGLAWQPAVIPERNSASMN